MAKGHETEEFWPTKEEIRKHAYEIYLARRRDEPGSDQDDWLAAEAQQNLARPGGSALDARIVRHAGYAVSQWMIQHRDVERGPVRELIVRQFGVRYHEAHARRILRYLRWSGHLQSCASTHTFVTKRPKRVPMDATFYRATKRY